MLQFIDGFDHYYISNDVGFQGGAAAMEQKWDTTSFAGEMRPSQVDGRFGGGALRIKGSSGGGLVRKNVDTNRDEMIVGFAFKPASAQVFSTIVKFNMSDGGFVQCALTMASSTIQVASDTGISDTSAAVLTSGSWQYIEFRVKVGATGGEVEVRRNTTVITNLTSQNTGEDGVTIASMELIAGDNNQLDFVDDLYWLDMTGTTNNDFLGDCRVSVLHAKGDGATNDFSLTSDTPADTLNFQAIVDDDGLWSDRDHSYVESGLIGAREIYDTKNFSDLGIVPTAVFGVQVVNNCKRTATGILKYKDELTIAGTQYDNGVEITTGTGDYHMSRFITDVDPSDSAAWTAAKVEAISGGIVITERQI